MQLWIRTSVWALLLCLGCGGGGGSTEGSGTEGSGTEGSGDSAGGETGSEGDETLAEPIVAERAGYGLMALPLVASPEPAAYGEGSESDAAAREHYNGSRFEEATSGFLEAAARFREGAGGPQGESLSRMADLSCENAALAHASATGDRLADSRAWVVSQDADCGPAFDEDDSAP